MFEQEQGTAVVEDIQADMGAFDEEFHERMRELRERSADIKRRKREA